MKVKKSEFLMAKKEELRKIVDILLKEYEYVSLLATDVSGKSYSVNTSGVNVSPNSEEERGFVIRVFNEGLVSEYSFNVLDVDLVVNEVKEIVSKDRIRFKESSKQLRYERLPKDEKDNGEFLSEVKNPLEEDKASDILEKLTLAHDKAKEKYSQIISLYCDFSITQVNKMFLSKNKDLYQSYVYSVLSSTAFAANENDNKVDFMSKSGMVGSEILDDLEEIVNEACERAEELLKSEKVIPGTYDIICDPDFTGLIAHEAFGHGAEMDMYVKRRAKGQEFTNERVASDKVFMHDGAKSAQEVSSYLFDDEGNRGCDTLIIDKGILKQGMCDELSSILLDTHPTGNGKRESYKRKAYTRMTNTFFQEGEDALEDMIKSIENGYLLEGFSSGMEDPKNWGIQCVAAKGREIKNGELTGKIVSPVYLTGYVPDLLKSISMVSKGLKLSGAGFCGKGVKEWVKTSTGGSYIKAKGVLS